MISRVRQEDGSWGYRVGTDGPLFTGPNARDEALKAERAKKPVRFVLAPASALRTPEERQAFARALLGK